MEFRTKLINIYTITVGNKFRRDTQGYQRAEGLDQRAIRRF